MGLFCGGIADDVHVECLRLGVPHVEADAGRLLIQSNALGQADGIGAALLHVLWQLEEEPVVEFARQGVVGIHRLRLAPDGLWRCGAECFVVGRTDSP